MLGTENVNVIAIIPYVNLAIEINDWYKLNNLVMLPLLRTKTFLEFFRHAQIFNSLRLPKCWIPEGISFSCGLGPITKFSRRGNALSSIDNECNAFKSSRRNTLTQKGFNFLWYISRL